MPALARQRCLHHSSREAVARCPECGQFFCRECITEHDDRMVCSACLRKLTVTVETKRRNFALPWRGLAAAAGLLTAWLFFFFMGRFLVNIPAEYHESTIWKNRLLNMVEERGE